MLAKFDQTVVRNTAPPDVPWSWYHACSSCELARGPVGLSIGAKQFVLYRAVSGKAIALSRRCVHMGADLAAGHVEGDCLRCPLHEWKYDAAGRCVEIPASAEVPDFARQVAFPVAEIGGHVFLFNQTEALFPFPFFSDCDPQEFFAARPIVMQVEIPWYMVGANGFDIQHFRTAHDRALVGEPWWTAPGPYCRQITAVYDVAGQSMRDVLTRWLSGSRSQMTVTSWLGTIIHAKAEFERTTSYGIVCVRPTSLSHCEMRVIVWLPRRHSLAGRWVADPIDSVARRWFIHAFMRDDQVRSAGIQFNRASLIDADQVLAAYLDWIVEAAHGESFS